MQVKKLILGPLFLFSILSVANCSRKDSVKQTSLPLEDVVDDDLSEYDISSCKYKYAEGSSAYVSNYSDVHTTFFNKDLDFALLAPVLAASGAETVRFAQIYHVRFYKTTPRNKKNCEFLQVLPQAPSDLMDAFSESNSDDTTLGLYLAEGTKNLPSVAPHAAILVRNDANKWVLVHEYIHHLYQLQRNVDFGIPTEDIKSRIIRLSKEFEDIYTDLISTTNNNYDTETLNTAVSTLIGFYEGTLELLREYLLEEMTIENILAEKFEQKELKYVPDLRLNGAAYSISSANKVQDTFLFPLQSELNMFMLNFQNNLTSKNIYDLEQIQLKMQNMDAEITILKKKMETFLQSLGFEYQSFRIAQMNSSKQSKKPVELECTHQKDINEFIQIFNQRHKFK